MFKIKRKTLIRIILFFLIINHHWKGFCYYTSWKMLYIVTALQVIAALAGLYVHNAIHALISSTLGLFWVFVWRQKYIMQVWEKTHKPNGENPTTL